MEEILAGLTLLKKAVELADDKEKMQLQEQYILQLEKTQEILLNKIKELQKEN